MLLKFAPAPLLDEKETRGCCDDSAAWRPLRRQIGANRFPQRKMCVPMSLSSSCATAAGGESTNSEPPSNSDE